LCQRADLEWHVSSVELASVLGLGPSPVAAAAEAKAAHPGRAVPPPSSGSLLRRDQALPRRGDDDELAAIGRLPIADRWAPCSVGDLQLDRLVRDRLARCATTESGGAGLRGRWRDRRSGGREAGGVAADDSLVAAMHLTAAAARARSQYAGWSSV